MDEKSACVQVPVEGTSTFPVYYNVRYRFVVASSGLGVTYDGQGRREGQNLVVRDTDPYRPNGKWVRSTYFYFHKESSASVLYHYETKLPVTYDGKSDVKFRALTVRDWTEYGPKGKWRPSVRYELVAGEDGSFRLRHSETGSFVSLSKVDGEQTLVVKGMQETGSGESFKLEPVCEFCSFTARLEDSGKRTEGFADPEQVLRNGRRERNTVAVPNNTDMAIHSTQEYVKRVSTTRQLDLNQGSEVSIQTVRSLDAHITVGVDAGFSFLGAELGTKLETGVNSSESTQKSASTSRRTGWSFSVSNEAETKNSLSFTIPPRSSITITSVRREGEATVEFLAKLKVQATIELLYPDGLTERVVAPASLTSACAQVKAKTRRNHLLVKNGEAFYEVAGTYRVQISEETKEFDQKDL